MLVSADKTIALAPVLAIYGHFQDAEKLIEKYLLSMGHDDEGCKILPPLVAALCGKTADAQRQLGLKQDAADCKLYIIRIATLVLIPRR